jgi:hypothetical protein
MGGSGILGLARLLFARILHPPMLVERRARLEKPIHVHRPFFNFDPRKELLTIRTWIAQRFEKFPCDQNGNVMRSETKQRGGLRRVQAGGQMQQIQKRLEFIVQNIKRPGLVFRFFVFGANDFFGLAISRFLIGITHSGIVLSSRRIIVQLVAQDEFQFFYHHGGIVSYCRISFVPFRHKMTFGFFFRQGV